MLAFVDWTAEGLREDNLLAFNYLTDDSVNLLNCFFRQFSVDRLSV